MKKTKKLLATFLALIMVLSTLSIMSVNSFAATNKIVEAMTKEEWVFSVTAHPYVGHSVVTFSLSGDNIKVTEQNGSSTTDYDTKYEIVNDDCIQFDFEDLKLTAKFMDPDNRFICLYYNDKSFICLMTKSDYEAAVNNYDELENSYWQIKYSNSDSGNFDLLYIDKSLADLYDEESYLYINGEKINTFDAAHQLNLFFYHIPVDKDTILAAFYTDDDSEFPGLSYQIWTRVTDVSGMFPDVRKNAWYASAVSTVVKSGIFSGYQNGAFGPANDIIRQDFAVVMAKAAGADLENQSTDNLTFKDIDKNSYYAKALAWCVENGIISGYENGNFGPSDKITREQLCVMIYNYMIKLGGKSDRVTMLRRAEIFNHYPDGSNVSGWAARAVSWCVDREIISGANGGRVLQPTASANRAQVATIFANMIQNGLL